MTHSRVNWRQAAGEALLILLGVGLAMLAQTWWEYRTERESERHLLEGVVRDLQMDSTDLSAAINSARSRAAAADYLLAMVGDAAVDAPRENAGDSVLWRFGVARTQGETLQEVRSVFPHSAQSPGDALGRLGGAQRFDIANNTYREATASGQLEVIRDIDLRASIGEYYFGAQRFGVTNDERMIANARDLRARLADSGFSPEAPAPDTAILEAVRDDPSLRAELHNVRGLALRQIRLWGLIQYDGSQLASRLQDWLAGN